MSGVVFKVTADTNQADRRLDEINKSVKQINVSASALSSTFSNAFRNIAATIGLVNIASTLKSASDAAINLENRIKTVAYTTYDVAAAQKAVLDLSLETHTVVASTTEMYTRYSKAAESLGASSRDVLDVTKLTAQAIQLSGSNADSANAAVIQLGQGLSSGVLRGEELNSVLEQAPRLAQALADGIGTSVGQLRNLGAAGSLSSETVFNALLSQAEQLNSEFGRSTATMANRITDIKTATSLFASEAMKGVGGNGLSSLMSSIASAIYFRADTIQTDVASVTNSITLKFTEIKALGGSIANVFVAIGKSAIDALPMLAKSRTLFGDLISIGQSVQIMLTNVLKEPFRAVATYLRDIKVYFLTGFGLLDFQVPKAMRELFDSRSLLDFTKAFNDLAKGIDSNTSFILNRLSSIPRSIKYFTEDVGIYLGVINKPFTLRLGYFEPFIDSLKEISAGFVTGVKWSTTFAGSLSPIGLLMSAIGRIMVNVGYVLFTVFKYIGAALGGMVQALDTVFSRLANFAKSFSNENVFADVMASSKKFLDSAFYNIEKFGSKTIGVFHDIWDAVIGHSWWTDTVNSVVSTSNSLWHNVSSGLQSFSKNVKNIFKDIFYSHPIKDTVSTVISSAIVTIKDIRAYIGKIDFVDLGAKLKQAFIDGITYLKESFPQIIQNIGVGALLVGIASLFPGTALANLITTKALLAFGIASVILSDKLISQITGTSALGEIATNLGEVLGRELWRFITRIPDIINFALNTILGFFKGFVSSLPFYVGDILNAFLNIPILGNGIGIVGSILFGGSVLTLLNMLGLVKTTVATLAVRIASVFSIPFLTTSMAKSGIGMVGTALFGPKITAILALIVLLKGGLDGLFDNSGFAKAIAIGGLISALLFGYGGAAGLGTVFTTIIAKVKVFTLAFSKAMSWLFGMKIFDGVQVTNFKLLLDALILGVRMLGNSILLAFNNLTFGTVLSTQLGLISKAFASLQVMFSTFAASPAGQFLSNNKKKLLAGAIIGGGLLLAGGSAKAEGLSDQIPGAVVPELPKTKNWIQKVYEAISDSINWLMDHVWDIAAGLLVVAQTGLGAWLSGLLTAASSVAATTGTTLTGILLGMVAGSTAAIVAAIVAVLATVSFGIIEFVGEGDTFAEKLEDVVYRIRKAINMLPSANSLETDTKTAMTPAAMSAVKELGTFDPNTIDFAKIDPNLNSSKNLHEFDKSIKDYSKALIQATKEINSTGLLPGTLDAVKKQSDRAQKISDTLVKGSISTAPDVLLSKYASLMTQSRTAIGESIESFRTKIGLSITENNLNRLSVAKTYSSKGAKATASKLEALELDVSMAEERFSYATDASDKFLGWLSIAVAKINKGWTTFRMPAPASGFDKTSESFLKYSDSLKVAEDNVSAAMSAYQESSGIFKISDLQKEFLLKFSHAMAMSDGDKDMQGQLSSIMQSQIDRQAKLTGAWGTMGVMDRKRQTEALGILTQEHVGDLITLIDKKVITDAAAAINSKNSAIIASAEGSDKYKYAPLAMSLSEAGRPAGPYDRYTGRTAATEGTFEKYGATAKSLETIISQSTSNEERLAKLRQLNYNVASQHNLGTIRELEATKGVMTALSQLGKNTGNENIIAALPSGLGDDAAQRIKIAAEKLQSAQTYLATRHFDTGKLTKEQLTNLTKGAQDDVEKAQDDFEKLVKSIITPTEALKLYAKLSGVTLGDYFTLGLTTPKQVESVTDKLTKQWQNKRKLSALQSDPNADPSAVIKADNAVTRTGIALNKQFAGRVPKLFGELFSGALNIPIEALDQLDKVGFKTAVDLAKSLDSIEYSFSQLGQNATQTQIKKYLSDKKKILEDAAKSMIAIAYNSAEKVSAAFDSIGFTNANTDTIGIAKQFGSIETELTRLKVKTDDGIGYEAFNKLNKALTRSKELLKDIADSTFGGVFDRVNTQLKTSFSELSFSEFTDSAKQSMNELAIYTRHLMASVREGKLSGADANTALKEIDINQKRMSFIQIAKDMGKTIAESATMSYRGQLAAMKAAGSDINMSEDQFRQLPNSTRVSMLQEQQASSAISRLLDMPGFDSLKTTSILQDALSPNATLSLKEALERLKEAFIDENPSMKEAIAKAAQIPLDMAGQFSDLTTALKNLNGTISIYLGIKPKADSYPGANTPGYRSDYAVGGNVFGAGTATSDSIPAMLSNGEFVVNAKAANTYRSLLHRINNGQTIKLAGGGTSLLDNYDIGSSWADDNSEFEKTDPSFIRRLLRTLNPLTGLGSSIGILHDASARGDKLSMLFAALSAFPVFAGAKVGLKTLLRNYTTAPIAASAVNSLPEFGGGGLASGVDLARRGFLKINTIKAMASQSSAGKAIADDKMKEMLLDKLVSLVNPKITAEEFIGTPSKFLSKNLSIVDSSRRTALLPAISSSLPSLGRMSYAYGASNAAWDYSNGFVGPKISDWLTDYQLSSENNDGEAWYDKFKSRAYAAGGNVFGAGTATSDSIPAMLSHGEFVVNAKAASTYRNLLERINSGNPLKLFEGTKSDGTKTTVVPGLNSVVIELKPIEINLKNKDDIQSALVDKERQRLVDASKAYFSPFMRVSSSLSRLGYSNLSSLDFKEASKDTKLKLESAINDLDAAYAKHDVVAVEKAKIALDKLMEVVSNSLAKLARAAGDSMRTSVQSTISEGLKNSLKGKNGEEGGITLTKIIDSVTGNIIDKTVEGFTDSLLGSKSTLGGKLYDLGKNALESGANFLGNASGDNGNGTGDLTSAPAEGMWSKISNTFSEAMPGLSSVLSDSWAAFSGVFKSGLNGLKDMLSKLDFSGFGSGSGFSTLLSSVGGILGLADGGSVSGKGTGTSDSIPAMLSNGEFVVNAKAAGLYHDLLTRINSNRFTKFADGGIVGVSNKVGGTTTVSASALVTPLENVIARTDNIANALTDTKVAVAENLTSLKDGTIEGFKSVDKTFTNLTQDLKMQEVNRNVAQASIKTPDVNWLNVAIQGAMLWAGAGAAKGGTNYSLSSSSTGLSSMNGGTGLRLGSGTGLKLATGGYVFGSGTSISDSIPAMLSNGEFVVNAEASKQYSELLSRINSGKMPKFAVGGPVNGSLSYPLDSPKLSQIPLKRDTHSVFNINVTGDVSMQTRREIQQMIPQIATGVNMHNYEQGATRR